MNQTYDWPIDQVKPGSHVWRIGTPLVWRTIFQIVYHFAHDALILRQRRVRGWTNTEQQHIVKVSNHLRFTTNGLGSPLQGHAQSRTYLARLTVQQWSVQCMCCSVQCTCMYSILCTVQNWTYTALKMIRASCIILQMLIDLRWDELHYEIWSWFCLVSFVLNILPFL